MEGATAPWLPAAGGSGEGTPVMEPFSVLIAMAVPQIHTCDKMAWNQTHPLCRCQFAGCDVTL